MAAIRSCSGRFVTQDVAAPSSTRIDAEETSECKRQPPVAPAWITRVTVS